MLEAPPPDWQPYTDAELQVIMLRLSALVSEPPSEQMANELEAIRAHLRLLSAGNAAIGRQLRVLLGLELDEPLQ